MHSLFCQILADTPLQAVAKGTSVMRGMLLTPTLLNWGHTIYTEQTGEQKGWTPLLETDTIRLFLPIIRRRQWHLTPVLSPGKSHGRRSLVGCSPWGRWGSDTTERLHLHFSLSCIGEGNGNPLQCSCLENPRDGGAWWAAVHGVAKSRTRLKRLSSSKQELKDLATERVALYE